MHDAEMALAARVSRWEVIFCGDTTIEIRKIRVREAVAGRMQFAAEFERVYGEPL